MRTNYSNLNLTNSFGNYDGSLANSGERLTLDMPDITLTTNINGIPGVGKARIEGGKVVFEGSATRGVATLYEGAGRRVLKGDGTWVGYDGRSAFELTKR